MGRETLRAFPREEKGVEERSKEWIVRPRERSGREEQRIDRKRKRAEWKRGAKNR
jgi:hypothetical protein